MIPLLMALLAAGAAQWPVPFEANGRWGYRSATGAVLIPPRFVMAQEFSPEGIAAVVDERGWAYIDAKGKLIVRPYVFDNGPDYFEQDLARFVDNGKIGFMDRRARIVIPAKFDFALPFSEDRAAVCSGCKEAAEGEHKIRRGGKWGFIDRTGRLVIPFRYDEVERFSGGKARVRSGGGWRVIGQDGALQQEPAPVRRD